MTTTMTTKMYELPTELWSEVLSYTAPCLEHRLRKSSIPALHNIFKLVFKRRWTNIKCADNDIEVRRNLMLDPLLKFHFKHDLTRILNVYRLIELDDYDWKTLYKNGDIVYDPRSAGTRTQFAKVLRRNKKSMTITYYMPITGETGLTDYYMNVEDTELVYDARYHIVIDKPWEDGNVPDYVQRKVDKLNVVLKPPLVKPPNFELYYKRK